MAKRPGSKVTRISAEERQLEQQRAEVMRRQQLLEKRLKVLPAVMEAQEEQKRELSRRRAAEGGRAISPSMGRVGRKPRKALRMPSRERWYAKTQTLILLAILAIIALLLWHTVPPLVK